METLLLLLHTEPDGSLAKSALQALAAALALGGELTAGLIGAAIVLAPATSRWSRAIPGAAFRLNGRVDTHATGLALHNRVPVVTRWFYRQRMEAVMTRVQRPWFVLLDGGCCAPWNGPAGSAIVEVIAVDAATRTTVTGI